MPDLPALRRYDWRELLPSERDAMTEWVRSLGYDPMLIATRFAVTRDDAGRWAVHLTRHIPEADGKLRVDVAAEQVVSRPVVVETAPATWPTFLGVGRPARPYTPPLGCRICRAEQRGHARRWSDTVGWHGWLEPTRVQIVQRMRTNRGLPLRKP